MIRGKRSTLGRANSGWQARVIIGGIATLIVILGYPTAKVATTLVTRPAGGVSESGQAGTSGMTNTSLSESAQASADPAVPASPAAVPQVGSVPATVKKTAHSVVSGATLNLPMLAGTGQMLFSDNFANDPTATGVLPAGWSLDGLQTATGLLPGVLGSLPLTVPANLPLVVPSSGTNVLDRVSQSWSYLSAGSAWSNYLVSAAMQETSSAPGYVGIAGRYLDPGNYYSCGVANGSTLQMWKVVAGQRKLLGSTPIAPLAVGAVHTLKLAMKGSLMACAVDTSAPLTMTDTALSSGKLALVALGDVTSQFDTVGATSIS